MLLFGRLLVNKAMVHTLSLSDALEKYDTKALTFTFVEVVESIFLYRLMKSFMCRSKFLVAIHFSVNR